MEAMAGESPILVPSDTNELFRPEWTALRKWILIPLRRRLSISFQCHCVFSTLPLCPSINIGQCREILESRLLLRQRESQHVTSAIASYTLCSSEFVTCFSRAQHTDQPMVAMWFENSWFENWKQDTHKLNRIWKQRIWKQDTHKIHWVTVVPITLNSQ